ncbi:MAG: TerC family protein [Solirubrobacteraceae bacterium]
MLYAALAGQAVLVACAFWRETRAYAAAEGSEAREALTWSLIWLALGLLPTLWFGLLDSSHQASSYAAVYLIERALSLDNVFVFAVFIAAFEIPLASRDRLVSFGAIYAFVVRIPAILVGVALFDASHVVGYALGALLIVLAWRTAHSDEEQRPSRVLTTLQRRLPVSEHVERGWIVRRDGRLRVTPLLLCLIALVVADITFAVDSIPAALAISHEAGLLLTANLLALLGLRALYHLVTIARARLTYMDETIAVLLALVGVKLLSSDLVHVGPVASLAMVLAVLAIGIAISLRYGEQQD